VPDTAGTVAVGPAGGVVCVTGPGNVTGALQG